MSKNKQYGLILTKKDSSSKLLSKPSIFDDESDDEKKSVEKSIKNEALKNLQKKQTRLELERAITEDATVFEYDNIYDELQKKKETQKAAKTKDRTPKYIQNLMKSAEQRKKDYERRTEKKIHKEREAEGEEFADKEAFVTSSYKKKMEEMQEEEEKERKQNEIEARMDVTKQTDLSGFYRHILKESTEETPAPEPPVQIKEEKSSSSSGDESTPPNTPDLTLIDIERAHRAIKQNRESEQSKRSSTEEPIQSGSEAKKMVQSGFEAKKFVQSSSETKRSTSEAKKLVSGAVKTNQDNDSEFSVDSESSSTDSSDESSPKKSRKSSKERSASSRKRKARASKVAKKDKKLASRNSPSAEKETDSEKQNGMKNTAVSSDQSDDSESSSSENETNEKKIPKKEIPEVGEEAAIERQKKREIKSLEKVRELFKKRNTGEVFEAARDRYLKRKSAREDAKTVFAAA